MSIYKGAVFSLETGELHEWGDFMSTATKYQLIVTIVTRERTEKVLEAIKKEGATKSTVLPGRGISDNNPVLLFDIEIEPPREIIFTLVPKHKANQVFAAIRKAGRLEKPLHGLVFTLDVDKMAGAEANFM